MSLKPQYLFNQEEKCALIDMVRYNDATAVVECFRNELLLRVAVAAVNALYGDAPLPTPEELEHHSLGLTDDPSDQMLAMIFLPLVPLSSD